MRPELIRPRWGVGSVRLHLEPDDLALGLLLFDRIVVPTPSSEAEFDRWAKRGWQPEQLAKRAVQLADLVEYVPLFTVGWAVRRVLARLVPRPPRPDAGDEQGAALSMARREMATLYPE